MSKVSIRPHKGAWAVFVGNKVKYSGMDKQRSQVEANLVREDMGKALVDYAPAKSVTQKTVSYKPVKSDNTYSVAYLTNQGGYYTYDRKPTLEEAKESAKSIIRSGKENKLIIQRCSNIGVLEV